MLWKRHKVYNMLNKDFDIPKFRSDTLEVLKRNPACNTLNEYLQIVFFDVEADDFLAVDCWLSLRTRLGLRVSANAEEMAATRPASLADFELRSTFFSLTTSLGENAVVVVRDG